MRPWKGIALVSALAVVFSLPAGSAQSSKLLDILSGELERNFKILKDKATPPPYYAAYEVTETDTHSISAALGAIAAQSNSRGRRLDVTIRVGSPKLDNYHLINGRLPRFTRGVPIAIEDEPNALRQALWRETDRVYRASAERLIKIKTDSEVNIKEQDSPPDFSFEAPSTYNSVPPPLKLDEQAWAKRLRELSARFRSYDSVLWSSVSLVAQRQIKSFVNSEGTRISHGWTATRISISGVAKAPDGMDLVTSENFEANTPDGLPENKKILAAIDKVGGELTKMVDAPLVDPYVAPAILSGRASGVFFHEIFGHRVEGHRLRDASEGQTFANSIGTQVLPKFLSVIFDPTLRHLGPTDLMGWYDFDDQGVRARRVPVVEKGIMKTFLLSRAPVRGFSHSNGHGRRQIGFEVVSRQSNLIVESDQVVTDDRLRQMLLDEIKKQNKEYGFYFEQVTGGFTLTGRRSPQAFKVIPLVVYRVYADGRPDELVRGVDIVGTPLAAFSRILATGDTIGVFNGYCGAESGQVPVSASSPAILVSEIEVQRKPRSQDRPPLLPRPVLPTGEQQ